MAFSKQQWLNGEPYSERLVELHEWGSEYTQPIKLLIPESVLKNVPDSTIAKFVTGEIAEHIKTDARLSAGEWFANIQEKVSTRYVFRHGHDYGSLCFHDTRVVFADMVLVIIDRVFTCEHPKEQTKDWLNLIHTFASPAESSLEAIISYCAIIDKGGSVLGDWPIRLEYDQANKMWHFADGFLKDGKFDYEPESRLSNWVVIGYTTCRLAEMFQCEPVIDGNPDLATVKLYWESLGYAKRSKVLLKELSRLAEFFATKSGDARVDCGH